MEIYKIRSSEELAKKLARRKRRQREKGNIEDANGEETLTLGLTDRIPKCAQIKAAAKIKSFDIRPLKGAPESMRILCHLTNNSIQVHEYTYGKEDQEHRLLSTIEMQGHRSDVRALALSWDDELFASGSSDLLKIWNTQTRQCIHSITSGYILCCAFLPGNRYVRLVLVTYITGGCRHKDRRS